MASFDSFNEDNLGSITTTTLDLETVNDLNSTTLNYDTITTILNQSFSSQYDTLATKINYVNDYTSDVIITDDSVSFRPALLLK